PVAEMALSRMVLLDLYQKIEEPEFSKRLTALEQLGNKLVSERGQANFHYTLGMSLVELSREPRRAIFHLDQAVKLGMKQWQNHAAALVALGTLSEDLGEIEKAKQAYGLFVETYRRDNRTYTIKKRLEALSLERKRK